MMKQVCVVVKSFRGGEAKTWTTIGYDVTEPDDEEVTIHCFLDDVVPVIEPLPTSSVYVPRSPPPVISPPPYRAVVYDTQMWDDSAPVVASDEDEETQPQPFIHTPQPPIVTPPRRAKPGRPRGSKNKPRGDEAWRVGRLTRTGPTTKKRKVVSAEVMLNNIENGLECACCAENGEVLVKCSNVLCSQYLCLTCIGMVERRFEGVCPYCRQTF